MRIRSETGKSSVTAWVVALVLWSLSAALTADEQAGDKAGTLPAARKALGLRLHSLKEFGPTATPAEAEVTFRKALEALTKANGGLLVVPEDVAPEARFENVARWSHSVNPASGDLRDWQVGPGVTVIDNRQGGMVLRVPQVGRNNQAGITLERTLRLSPGDSLTHWTEESVLNIENNVIHGPCNYMEWLQEPTKAGKDARFYVPTVRNLFKGMFLNASEGPGYAGKTDRITVKDLGYDKGKRMFYFIADTTMDHVKGTIVQNKSHTPAIRIRSNLNAANQTFDVWNERCQYANGDSYMFAARFNYMDNVHSMPGDENGVCYAAWIYSDTERFRGAVKSVDAAHRKVVFKDGRNAHSLSNTRPLINLSQEKWVAKGKVLIVPPNDPTAPHDTADEGRWAYEGKSYPSRLAPGAQGNPELRVGGLIRGDKDCPWDESIIGRFFAVDEKSEYVNEAFGRTSEVIRRWYEIAEVKQNPNGTKDLRVKRYWWGAKPWDSVTLYDPENYTRDGQVRPLAYVIAPGAYVNDVSEAVLPGNAQGKPPCTLGVAPCPDDGTPFYFEPEDPVEQAIGPDPFKPQGVRVWTFDAVPGAWPSSSIDIGNFGVARSSAIMVHGGPTTLEECAKQRERRPAWDRVVSIDCAATVGLECSADFTNAAILFKQPNHEQRIKWHYAQQKGKAPKEATLTVSKDTGEFNFKGGGARFDGPVIARGLSADDEPARNLRGKNVPVKAGVTTLRVTFPVEEADADYAVFLEQNWLGNRAVVGKEAKGFTVQFEKPAPEGARLDWMIIR